MTPAQEQVLNAVRAHYATRSYAPSYKEIAARTGHKSLATVYKHVEALVKQKKLFRPIGRGQRHRALGLSAHAGTVIISGLLRPVICPGCFKNIPADTNHECEVR